MTFRRRSRRQPRRTRRSRRSRRSIRTGATPIVERGWLAYTAALRLIRSGPDYAKTIDAGLADDARALEIAPNDINAIELRGTLHYLQWLTNLAPNPDAAKTLLASAEQDLVAATNLNSQPARRVEHC